MWQSASQDATGLSKPASATMAWMQPETVRHWAGVSASLLPGGKNNLWSLQPSAAQRTSLHRVLVNLEEETASPLEMIPKGTKPPLHGVWSSTLAARFPPVPPPRRNLFHPKGETLIHVDTFLSNSLHNDPTNHTPLLLHQSMQAVTPQPESVSIQLPDHRQSLPCQIPIWVGEMNLEFNSSRHL